MGRELWIMNDSVFCVVMNRFPPKFKDLLMPNTGSRTVCELSTLEKWGLWRNEVASVSRFRMMMSAYVRRNSYMLETLAWEGRKWRRTLLIAVTLRMDHITYMASLLKLKLLTRNLLNVCWLCNSVLQDTMMKLSGLTSYYRDPSYINWHAISVELAEYFNEWEYFSLIQEVLVVSTPTLYWGLVHWYKEKK